MMRPFDRLVLIAVIEIRRHRIATIERIRTHLISRGIVPEPSLQQIFRSLENLETSEYLESSLIKTADAGDVRIFVPTGLARATNI